MLKNLYDGLGFRTLLTDGDNNPKTALSNAVGEYYTSIMHLYPSDGSGHGNVCTSASPGCIEACLNLTGHGQTKMVQGVRKARTKLWFNDRGWFRMLLVKELEKFLRKCNKLGRRAAVRLNGTSDIIWEKQWKSLMPAFPTIMFYDYTKHTFRCLKSHTLPTNYHLTFSRSEINDKDCRKVLRSGKCNVAVVFKNQDYPAKWAGKPVYNAADTDLRFLDPPGGQVGALYAKGKRGREDDSGFVLHTLSSKVGGM